MVFLFSIIAQWFSRGVFLKIFIQQEASWFLIAILLGAIVLSSPIQGHMSDLTSRKKIILLGLLSTIASILIILFAPHITFIKFPIILGIAAVINGVFGNVFPASGAAFSEQTGYQKHRLAILIPCRYLGMIGGFSFFGPQMLKLIFSIAIAVIALLFVIFMVEDKKFASEK